MKLVFVLVLRIQKSDTGNNNFVKWKRDILVRQTEMTRPVKVDLEGGPKYTFWSDQTEMVRSIWFLTENFRNFGLNGKLPLFSSLKIGFHVFARKLNWYFIGVYIIKTQLLLTNVMWLSCFCDFGTLNEKKKNNNWQTPSQISLNITLAISNL